MPVKAYVGVTDGDWYRFLAARPTLNEVNFWRPSGGRTFRVLTPGEPFFFKTHYPHNRVVGGGFFSGFAELRISEAWEFFGQANGTATLDEMRQRVGRYRRAPIGPGEDPVIGCIFVRDIVFLPPDTSVDPPPDFAPNIVQGKSYDLSELSARSYFEDLLRNLLGVSSTVDLSEPWHRLVLRTAIPASYRSASVRVRSRPSSSRHTAGGAPSPARRSDPYFRRLTSGRSRKAASTGSTTAYCSARICTPCTTAVTSASTRSTGSWSALACGRSSTTATISTPDPAPRSRCPNDAPTDPAESSSNGT